MIDIIIRNLDFDKEILKPVCIARSLTQYNIIPNLLDEFLKQGTNDCRA
jgi:hypothetical protein